MNYRLGLDIGTNSIGWAVLLLDKNGKPCRVVRVGSRIFSDGRDPKSKASLATDRRLARQMRRRRDRTIKRRTRFMDTLVQYGLMPPDPAERKPLASLDPYRLRAEGLEKELHPHHLGRALFHLNQRRGFLSNRKAPAKEDAKESSKIKSAVRELRSQLADYGSLGAYLYARKCAGKSARTRLRGEGKDESYDFYADRHMVKDEFNALWAQQATYHPELLTDEKRDELRSVLLFQRDLKPVRSGRCTLEPDDERAARALPLVQRFRIYQEANHLRVWSPEIDSRPLTLEERDRVVDKLLHQKTVTTDSIAKSILKLPPGYRLTHDDGQRKGFKGDETAGLMRDKSRFGADAWNRLTIQQQTEIVERLLNEPDETALINWLVAKTGLSKEAAEKVANTPLPEGYGSLGQTALNKIVPALEASVITYDKAVAAAGYDHRGASPEQLSDRLEYYGQVLTRHVAFGSNERSDLEQGRIEAYYGKIANPTVHVALNQLQKVVNALIDRFGRPTQIVVELARDLPYGPEKMAEVKKRQKENIDRNDRYNQELTKLGQTCNAANRLRLRLWEGLHPNPIERRCVYTGEQISIERLFSESVEIDHILPFSRTLDDGIANKIVSMRTANRNKGQQTPYEAFGHSPGQYDWEAIQLRAAALPEGARWRFGEKAMDRFTGENDFLARHLNETRYVSRLAREYLSHICHANHIAVTPGRLTAELRYRWDLHKLLHSDVKNRDDHRHHAIDAAVVALIDRNLLKRVATAASRAEAPGITRLLADISPPWAGLHRELTEAIERCVVSHKPDHGVQGALHEETAYGLVSGPDDKGMMTLQTRKMLSGMGKPGDIQRIADDAIKNQLLAATQGTSGKDFRAAITRFSEETGIRRVRIYTRMRPDSVVPIGGETPYKFYAGGSNYCVEITANEKGGWSGEFITTYQANQPAYRQFRKETKRYQKTSFSGKPLVMRLIVNDAVLIEDGKTSGVYRVVQLAATNKVITLANCHEAGALGKRKDDPEDAFKYLYKTPNSLKPLKARRIFVDILGYVKDPGAPDDDRTNRRNCGGQTPSGS